jgi:hypothetical protein
VKGELDISKEDAVRLTTSKQKSHIPKEQAFGWIEAESDFSKEEAPGWI